MKTFLTLSLSGLLLLSISGCHKPDWEQPYVGHDWKTEVEVSTNSQMLNFKQNEIRVPKSETRKLKDLVERTHPQKRVYARVMASKPPIDGRKTTRKRIQSTIRCLTTLGVPRENIDVTVLEIEGSSHGLQGKGTAHQNSKQHAEVITVALDQFSAIAPKCPKWSESINNFDIGGIEQSFGCANEENFARMIENPRDIIRGRGAGYSDGAHNSGSIDKYRKGKTETLKVEKFKE